MEFQPKEGYELIIQTCPVLGVDTISKNRDRRTEEEEKKTVSGLLLWVKSTAN